MGEQAAFLLKFRVIIIFLLNFQSCDASPVIIPDISSPALNTMCLCLSVGGCHVRGQLSQVLTWTLGVRSSDGRRKRKGRLGFWWFTDLNVKIIEKLIKKKPNSDKTRLSLGLISYKQMDVDCDAFPHTSELGVVHLHRNNVYVSHLLLVTTVHSNTSRTTSNSGVGHSRDRREANAEVSETCILSDYQQRATPLIVSMEVYEKITFNVELNLCETLSVACLRFVILPPVAKETHKQQMDWLNHGTIH